MSHVFVFFMAAMTMVVLALSLVVAVSGVSVVFLVRAMALMSFMPVVVTAMPVVLVLA